jgi:hypothetical protein
MSNWHWPRTSHWDWDLPKLSSWHWPRTSHWDW